MTTYALVAFAGIAAAGVAIALFVRRHRRAPGAGHTQARQPESHLLTAESTITPLPASEAAVEDFASAHEAAAAHSNDVGSEVGSTDGAATDAVRLDATPFDEPTNSPLVDGVIARGANADDSRAERAEANVEASTNGDATAAVAVPPVGPADVLNAAASPTIGVATLDGADLEQTDEFQADSEEPPSAVVATALAEADAADVDLGEAEQPCAIESQVEEPRSSPSPRSAASSSTDTVPLAAIASEEPSKIELSCVEPALAPAPTRQAALPAPDAEPVDIEEPQQQSESEPQFEDPSSSTPMPRTPRQYRPPRSAPPRPRPKTNAPAGVSTNAETRLDISVRLVFERGGFCRLSLIPQKDERMDGDITASSASSEIELVPLQENLYSDVFPVDMASALRNGLEWTAAGPDGAQLRWSLGGREVYVLGQHEHISGYVSMPRVLLGATHVVVCIDEHAREVSEIIAAAGSSPTTVIGQAEGLPIGWTGFAGVNPTIPIPQSGEHDILNILRPRPDISIALEDA